MGADGERAKVDVTRAREWAREETSRERSHVDELTERIAADPGAAASAFYAAYTALRDCAHHGFDEWNNDAAREWEAIGEFMYPDRPTVVDVAERAIES